MATISDRMPSHHPTSENRTPAPPFPQQHQDKPGLESELQPKPLSEAPSYRSAGKLRGRVALVTGGDSGIGRSVAILYAREGADCAITFLPSERSDAEQTKQLIEGIGQRCHLIALDLTDAKAPQRAVQETVTEFGGLDILVHNAGYQNRKPKLTDISDEEFDHTYQVNVYGFFRLAKAALPHLKKGSSIIATASIQGLKPSPDLFDYASSKAAIIAMTKSLAASLAKEGVRVNAVAPGPVWTPLNVVDAGASPEKVATFGHSNPAGRPAQPEEVAPAYVFLASNADSGFITGEVIVEAMMSP